MFGAIVQHPAEIVTLTSRPSLALHLLQVRHLIQPVDALLTCHSHRKLANNLRYLTADLGQKRRQIASGGMRHPASWHSPSISLGAVRPEGFSDFSWRRNPANVPDHIIHLLFPGIAKNHLGSVAEQYLATHRDAHLARDRERFLEYGPRLW